MRMKWIVIVLLVLAIGLLVTRCQDADGVRNDTSPAASVDGQPGVNDAELVAPPVGATLTATNNAQLAAMQAAVSTLHRYLTALGTGDPAKYDPFWSGGKRPADSHEADLHRLQELRAFKIENQTPERLDSSEVPEALEIPVTLRASFKQQPMRRYQGWYRMRSKAGGREWEITSARIDPRPAAQ